MLNIKINFGMSERTVDVKTLSEASYQLRKSVHENEYRASDMKEGCGDVLFKGTRIAVVSYNGRVWDNSWDNSPTEITGAELKKVY